MTAQNMRQFSTVMCSEIQGYKDIYSPMTLKCTQEFVLVTLHSYSTLTNSHGIAISHV